MKQTSPTLDLAIELVRRASLTPDDLDCQALLSSHLQPLGFDCQNLPFGQVSNLWAKYGQKGPLLVFAGHTDVVPTGPLEQWDSPPFEPQIRDGLLYGRGSADMKGSLAAMIMAAKRLIEAHADEMHGSLGFLITSDEEGDAVDGTIKVVDHLQMQNEKIDWCLVGEPSSAKQLGDTVRNGRRGSLSGIIKFHGKQGHVAYPQLAKNALHSCLIPLQRLCEESWDNGNEYFPPTSFQISNIHAGTGAHNVIPGDTDAIFNFRFSTELDVDTIQERVKNILDQQDLDYSLEWRLFGLPFFTAPGTLTDAVEQAIKQVTGLDTLLSTGGGTSDGRFIAPTGAHVVELGPINASIHQINEHVSVKDLDALTEIYYHIMHRLLCSTNEE